MTASARFDPDEIVLRGRLGALVLHSRRNPRKMTCKACEALAQRWLDTVDPDRTLPEAERLRRAEHLRRAHFTHPAFEREPAKSQARARKKANASPGEGEALTGEGVRRARVEQPRT
jgi:hypothetical protein